VCTSTTTRQDLHTPQHDQHVLLLQPTTWVQRPMRYCGWKMYRVPSMLPSTSSPSTSLTTNRCTTSEDQRHTDQSSLNHEIIRDPLQRHSKVIVMPLMSFCRGEKPQTTDEKVAACMQFAFYWGLTRRSDAQFLGAERVPHFIQALALAMAIH
jgi:hypothetical protein